MVITIEGVGVGVIITEGFLQEEKQNKLKIRSHIKKTLSMGLIHNNLFRFCQKPRKFKKLKMEGDDVVSHNKRMISLWEAAKVCSKLCKTVKFEEQLNDDDKSCLSI